MSLPRATERGGIRGFDAHKKARQKAGDSEYENVIDYAALELAETVARTLAFRKIEERLTAEGEPAKNLQIPAGRIQKEKISKPALDVPATTAEPVCWSSSSNRSSTVSGILFLDDQRLRGRLILNDLTRMARLWR